MAGGLRVTGNEEMAAYSSRWLRVSCVCPCAHLSDLPVSHLLIVSGVFPAHLPHHTEPSSLVCVHAWRGEGVVVAPIVIFQGCQVCFRGMRHEHRKANP